MFGKLAEKIREIKRRKEFNAENCIRKQFELERQIEKKRLDEEKRMLDDKVDTIKRRIYFVVEDSPDQHTVSFQINQKERETYYKVKEHFVKLGFKVAIIKIDEFDDDEELMIISWKQDYF